MQDIERPQGAAHFRAQAISPPEIDPPEVDPLTERDSFPPPPDFRHQRNTTTSTSTSARVGDMVVEISGTNVRGAGISVKTIATAASTADA
jgi:hypothetical protein